MTCRRLVPALLAAAVLGVLAASVTRVPADRALAVRWLSGARARLVASGWAFAPPVLTHREWLVREAGEIRVSGSTQAPTRDGAPATFSWRAALAPGIVPSGPEGSAARLAADLQPVVAARVAAGNAAGTPDGDMLPGLVRERPEWRTALRSLTVRIALPAGASQATRFAALRDRVGAGGRRVALIGWDAADWELLDRLIARGTLPNLERLIARGASARLVALKPLISPLIWTSIGTGVPPDVHGIYDFLRPSAHGGTEPITSFDRKAPALWNIASALGRSVGAVAWWASWPAEPVEGFVISDRVSYQLSGYESRGEKEGLVYPANAAEWMLPLRRDDHDVTDAEIRQFVGVPAGALDAARASGKGYADPLIHLSRVLASTDTYHRMTMEAFRRYRPSLLFAYVEGTDTIGHLFGPFTPPRQAHISEEDVRRYGHAADRYYAKADAQLGELLDLLGPETTILLCSDHGFTWGHDRPREASGTHTPTAAWWHRPEGALVLSGPGIRHVPQRGRAHVLDIAPTIAALSGLPAGKNWTGTTLDWALESPRPAVEPVDWMALLPPQARPEGTAADPNASEYLARLQALGYVASDGGADATPTPAPETLSALMNRGSVLLDRGDVAGALAAYRRATELQPGAPGPWLKLAVAQGRTGDRAEALESYRRALSVAREHAHRESAYLGQGVMLAELGREQDAMAALQAGVRELPDSFILWNTLGGLHVTRRELPLARAAFGEATKAHEDPDTLNSLAALELAVAGDAKAARRLWLRSLELKPDQPDVERALRELREGAGP